MNWTTRRFPRTSQAEPWRGVVQHFPPPLKQRVWNWIFTVSVSAGASVFAFYYLSK